MSERFWVIELQPGPIYLATRFLGKYEFIWTHDIRGSERTTVLKFADEASATSMMLNLRAICRELFPDVMPHSARSVEHAWISTNEPAPSQLATAVQRILE